MKKIVYIVMLLPVFMLSGGFQLVYKIEQCVVRIEMLAALNNKLNQSEKIILSVSDFQKSKIDSREIFFKGKMYDIRSIRRTGNTVELFVINDAREERILEKIKELENDTGRRHHLPGKLIELLTLVYICPATGNTFWIDKQPTCFLPFCELLIFNKSDIHSPPPKLS